MILWRRLFPNLSLADLVVLGMLGVQIVGVLWLMLKLLFDACPVTCPPCFRVAMFLAFPPEDVLELGELHCQQQQRRNYAPVFRAVAAVGSDFFSRETSAYPSGRVP